jgi:hypothetical protein
MTCDVRLQLAEVRCAVASCDVHAEPILVVCNLRCACVRCILRLGKCDRNIAHYFGNNERTDDANVLSFGVSCDFVAQKWRILAIFPKNVNFWEITWKVLEYITMFKS